MTTGKWISGPQPDADLAARLRKGIDFIDLQGFAGGIAQGIQRSRPLESVGPYLSECQSGTVCED
jgi:hypothetical protein